MARLEEKRQRKEINRNQRQKQGNDRIRREEREGRLDRG